VSGRGEYSPLLSLALGGHDEGDDKPVQTKNLQDKTRQDNTRQFLTIAKARTYKTRQHKTRQCFNVVGWVAGRASGL